MPFANGSEARIAYVTKSASSAFTAAPQFQQLRTTGGGGMKSNKSTGVSKEIQPDRNVRDEYLLGLDPQGSYNGEFSYGTYDDILAGAFFGAWTGNVLANGVAPTWFDWEETLFAGGSIVSISRYQNCMIDSVSLDMTARKEIGLTWSMLGQQETLDTAVLQGSAYTAPTTSPILTASANLGSLSIGGQASAKVMSLKVDVKNNLRTRPEVGTLYSDDFGVGQCDVTGSIEAYFTDNSLYAAVLAHGGGDIAVTIGTAVGSRYKLDLPNTVFLNGARPIQGQNQDIMVTVPFRARYAPALGASLSLTRAV